MNLPKRSLGVELQFFFENLQEWSLRCTKGVFSLKRTKLSPLFFKVWNDYLVKNFYCFYREKVKRWEGFRLLAVDGSNFSVDNRPEVLEHFGSADNQFGGVPMAGVMQVQDVLNDLTVRGDIFPRKDGENEIIANLISYLPADSLALFGRGYSSYILCTC